MDRSFNFFDHPSLLRHSPSASNHHNSPSLLPQAHLDQQQLNHPNQRSLNRLHQREPQHNSHRQPQDSLPHSSHHHHPHHHQSPHLAHDHQQQNSQVISFTHHQRLHTPQKRQSCHQIATHSLLQSQSHSQPHYSQPIQPQLPMQPMDSHGHDAISVANAAGVSHNSSAQQARIRHHPRQRDQSQYRFHHLQNQHRPQQHAQHITSVHSHSQLHSQMPSNHQLSQESPVQFSQNPSQMSSLGLPANGSHNNAFPTSSLLTQNSQFGQISREIQPQQHSQYQNQPQGNTSHQNIAHVANSNSIAASHQLQLQPVLPTQQPTTATSFGSLSNLQGPIIPGSVGDDPAGSSNFQTSQSGDALGGSYPWETAHPQASVGSQALSGTQNQQQPMLPLPLVVDNRASNAASNVANNAQQNQSLGSHSNLHNNYGGAINSSVGILGSSMNTNTVVSGLVSGGNMSGISVQAVPETGTVHPNQTSNSIADGNQAAGKAVKKQTDVSRKSIASKRRTTETVQALGAPITSSIGVAAPQSLKRQVSRKSTASPPEVHVNRVFRGGKVRGRGRCYGRDQDVGHHGALTATTVAASSSTPGSGLTQTTDFAVATKATTGKGPYVLGKANETTGGWQGKKSSAVRGRNRRRNPDGTPSSTIPVHLRNPKRGRARVFRECQQCRSENHIRRSDCVACKAPLPAGKRRRDGNPSYSRKSTSSAIPNTHVVSNSRSGLKEEIAVSSVLNLGK